MKYQIFAHLFPYLFVAILVVAAPGMWLIARKRLLPREKIAALKLFLAAITPAGLVPLLCAVATDDGVMCLWWMSSAVWFGAWVRASRTNLLMYGDDVSTKGLSRH